MQLMRSKLRQATDTIHNALHHHPLLACMNEPDMSQGQYNAVLEAFYRFHFAIEETRAAQNVWPQFSLRQDLYALERDLQNNLSRTPIPTFDGGDYHILGALYVAHGSSFGRASFRKNLIVALPNAPHHFASRALSVSTWQELLMTLEQARASEQHALMVENGARDAFECMSELADRSFAQC